MSFGGVADAKRITEEMPWEARDVPTTVYQMVGRTAASYPNNKAVTFQLESGPKDPAQTLTWTELHAQMGQAANLFRSLGIGESDVVALVLPNSLETVVATLGGMTAGIVNPINPLLEAEQISAILRETGAKVVVTLKAFPKTDVAQKVYEAVRHATGVHTVLEIDLNRYLSPPKSWIVPFIRPKVPGRHHADIKNFNQEMAKQPTELTFADSETDRIGAYFHTGGTTGMPKVARHLHSGLVYNAWIGATLLFAEDDSIMCPLPMFHVFASHVMLMGACMSGAHVVFPTPAGYRGDGVFDNFWKLCERYRTTFIVSVPTAISALMQRPVNADVSSVKLCFSGSAPLPVELYKRFEAAAGLTILEGYGLTEATCLVSCNPDQGERKHGSVGVPFPYTDVRILDNSSGEPRECGVDEVGEICVANPGVFAGSTYTEEAKNRDLFHYDRYLRTGDLGRLDADGYLFITGRAKDLIIRGGHNIDPAEIEEALLSHSAVAFAGAIGQPDTRAGELPCVYVELVDGSSATTEELLAHCKVHVHERAAIPKYLEVMDELPKTAVGKVFKPELRKMAIARVFNAALAEAGLPAEVVSVVDDKKRGLTAQVARRGEVDEVALRTLLGNFANPWEWAEAVEPA
ncbi:fatty-acyl-CoA synthase/long-chain acyl-CoA synthetase [Pseudooceanicola antarcticus]|uniref:Acyl-CoA synthetase n=1 Tax=Pseudooceanicola antarcticus TaxID=1247613 RepID=A0A285JGW5_9RHOB|nr:acyl-CoA synthetase [Pseudooceanicola antarcticus]PJE26433.1 acyl-CoA synthetase [Pseudooceanicola antarcticus]SNY59518.1 fatty-acyl-CoA synthase/long-chain acyl-CoA synthetase [Pseudooceanicola antarcticus]